MAEISNMHCIKLFVVFRPLNCRNINVTNYWLLSQTPGVYVTLYIPYSLNKIKTFLALLVKPEMHSSPNGFGKEIIDLQFESMKNIFIL